MGWSENLGNRVLTAAATAPVNPNQGDLFFDTDDDQLYQWTGAAWVRVGYAVQAAAPATPDQGDGWYDTDDDRFYFFDGTNWRLRGSNVSDDRKRTGGHLTTLNNGAWTDLNPGWDGAEAQDLTLTTVEIGDEIAVDVAGLWGSQAAAKYFDVWSVVSGTVTNALSESGGAAGQGHLPWRGMQSALTTLGGTLFYRLLAGDIDPSGNLNLRLRFRTTPAGNNTLYADGDISLAFWARNLGPVT